MLRICFKFSRFKNTIGGFMEKWIQNYKNLTNFIERAKVSSEEAKLTVWLNAQRNKLSDNQISKEAFANLEKIPGFSWKSL